MVCSDDAIIERRLKRSTVISRFERFLLDDTRVYNGLQVFNYALLNTLWSNWKFFRYIYVHVSFPNYLPVSSYVEHLSLFWMDSKLTEKISFHTFCSRFFKLVPSWCKLTVCRLDWGKSMFACVKVYG